VFFTLCLLEKISVSTRIALLKRISKSFKAINFRVDNFLLNNPHFQTIVGSGALQVKLFGEYKRTFETRRERWDTPDGDFIDLEFTLGNENSNAIVVILHGLESETKSPLVTKMATAFLKKGFQCCLVSFRSCSDEDNKTLGAYHLGFTDDINLITSKINALFPEKSIYLSGFSLGGNVILKFLGELGEEAWSRNICGASVTCVPFDPISAQVKLDKGFCRAVYIEVCINTYISFIILQINTYSIYDNIYMIIYNSI
jgi:predicted alpha/beta-fold hydrolase